MFTAVELMITVWFDGGYLQLRPERSRTSLVPASKLQFLPPDRSDLSTPAVTIGYVRLNVEPSYQGTQQRGGVVLTREPRTLGVYRV